MLSINKKAELIFWFLGCVLSIIYTSYYFFDNNSTLDINIHDTYFIIAKAHIIMTFGFWFLICGFGYSLLKFFNRKLIPWLSLVHLILSLISLCLILIEFRFINFLDTPERYYEITGYPDTLNYLGILFFIIAQSVFFVHITIAAAMKGQVK
jgi:heme/copper-type cytochrome/quinol oxidase subunit 1